MDINENKILKYNIVIYLLLLVMETGNNILFSLSSAKTGKVLSSLYGDASGLFRLILPEFLFYVVILTSIYMIFAWLNASIIQRLLLKIKDIFKREINDYFAVSVFFIVNGVFIFINYCFVGLLYPLSYHNVFNFSYLPQFNATTCVFYVFVFFYFLTAYWSLAQSKKIVRYGCAALFLFSFSYNMWPQIQSSFPLNNDNKGNQGPNVIILGIDSLRSDYLVRNGNSQMIAPNVEKFLEKSHVFTNAYTPLARTFPSWMSILTGKYPSETGIRYNLIQRHRYSNDHPTLSELLQEQYGYYTVHAMDETRFCNLIPDDGFDELMHPVTGIVDFLFGRMHDYSLSNLYFNNRIGGILFPFIKNNRAVSNLYDGKQFVHDIENKLTSLKDKDRFFFAAHLCAAHWPYTLRGLNKGTMDNPIMPHDRYREAIKMADEQLGLIIEAIKRNDLYDNSIIVVLSDHGESFDSNWGHGTTLYDDSQNHIVLGIKPVGYNGHNENENNYLVSTVDIAPTIVDLIGVESSDSFSGKSIFAVNEDNWQDDTKRAVFMETGFHLFHSFGKGFTIEEMVNVGAAYYKVSPETKKIIVKDEYHEKIIDTKQLSLLTEEWRLIAQKDRDDNWNVDLFKFNDKKSSRNLRDQFPLVVDELLPRLAEHFNMDINLSETKMKSAARSHTVVVN